MDCTDNDGNTVWLAVAQSQNVELLRKLLERGCNVHATNDSKCTALHYACRAGALLSKSGLAEYVSNKDFCHQSSASLPFFSSWNV